jgi:hypothetical protein
MSDEPIKIWFSAKESDRNKVTLFNEAVAQGRIVVYWESYYDEQLAPFIEEIKEVDDAD